MATKLQQIKALLNGRACQFACAELGVASMANHSYDEVFTVSLADFEKYVDKHGLPGLNPNGSYSGGSSVNLWLHKDGDKWRLSVNDRHTGEEWACQVFEDYASAKKALLSKILEQARMGIKIT